MVNGSTEQKYRALNIETGVEVVEVVEEGMGSAQVGELKAVLLAVKEKARAVDVDSYAVWAGATHWLCQ